MSSLRNERLKLTSATVTFQVFKANNQTITFDAVVFKLPMPKNFNTLLTSRDQNMSAICGYSFLGPVLEIKGPETFRVRRQIIESKLVE